MTKLQMLKKEAQSLSARDLAKLRAFLAELDEALWDAEIEADSRSGALGFPNCRSAGGRCQRRNHSSVNHRKSSKFRKHYALLPTEIKSLARPLF